MMTMDPKQVAAAQRAADSALAQAQAAHGDLVREKIAAVARQSELEGLREQLAFEGLRGSAADRKKLADATAEAARIDLETQNMTFAIAAAEKHITAAEAAVARADARPRVIAAQGQVRAWRAAGAAASDHLTRFLDTLQEVYDLAGDIDRLGIDGGLPRAEIVRSSIARAVQATLFRKGLHNQLC